MCLELCGANSTEIAAELEQLAAHKDVIRTVSFEGYRMWNSQLVRNPNVTDVTDSLRRQGFRLYPLISSYVRAVGRSLGLPVVLRGRGVVEDGEGGGVIPASGVARMGEEHLRGGTLGTVGGVQVPVSD